MSENEPLILAMETSGDVCGVAVLRGETLLTEHTFRHGMHLSERLLGHVDAVLHEADSTLNTVEIFAIGIGPGSFTGTRMGVMTLKTLAFLKQKPLIGVNSLEALAAEYAGLRSTVVVPILPCRTGVVYTAAYAVESPVPTVLAEPAALSLSDLAAQISGFSQTTILFCGPALPRYADELLRLLEPTGKTVYQGQIAFPRAGRIGQLAAARAAEQQTEDALTLLPLYVSPPPISQPKPLPMPS